MINVYYKNFVSIKKNHKQKRGYRFSPGALVKLYRFFLHVLGCLAKLPTYMWLSIRTPTPHRSEGCIDAMVHADRARRASATLGAMGPLAKSRGWQKLQASPLRPCLLLP